jgi:uncharacterized protein (TIGR02594 family)
MLAKIKESISPAPIPKWIRTAQREIGVREIRGGETKRIIEYHAATTLKATEDEISWCSSFVNWVFAECLMERTHSAAARSWLGWGKKQSGFRKYAVVVFKRGNSPWMGHVAFAMEDRGDFIQVLGGNQGDKVCYANYAKANVLGYFWPADAA